MSLNLWLHKVDSLSFNCKLKVKFARLDGSFLNSKTSSHTILSTSLSTTGNVELTTFEKNLLDETQTIHFEV